MMLNLRPCNLATLQHSFMFALAFTFIIYPLLTIYETVAINASSPNPPSYYASSMSIEEKHELRDTAKEMFFHAYDAYMENAYPADELQPLSCRGRWRHTLPARGDIDEALGNFSLTLVDSLDTLVVLGELDEFERAVRLVVRDVRFDADLIVSVFETNIRVLGGLLSGHILSEYLRDRLGRMAWYQGELLQKAKQLGLRLLPAFNTSTGIPHPRINLLHGMNVPQLANSRETCTACAGTMILEFAALARLTGEPVFEEKAHRAMDALWEQRHRGSDLVGTTINVHSGDWVRRDSGVGAGIDSYYEYCLKAYILLGDDRYLKRFNRHYDAVMKYISQGPMLLDVHMHRPHTTTRNFMDALLAFWPGLQVLKGDLKSAIETHEMLYQVTQRHNFLPEAFTTDFQVHWGQHLLRPEFLESTYLLHRATGDPYYLHAGKRVLQSLQRHAWVPCGFAAVKDVRTGQHEDRLDSFVLAETFKYLYLMFADDEDLVLDMDDFIFSTEAHLFPLSLARLSNLTAVPLRRDSAAPPPEPDVEFERSCPNTDYLLPGTFSESVRRPLSNLVEGTCPSRRLRPRRITAAQFQATNGEHRTLIGQLGVTMTTLPDGRVQLLHTASNARSPVDAEEGLLFMQEMIEMSRQQLEQPENPPRAVAYRPDPSTAAVTLTAGSAQFGPSLSSVSPVTGPLLEAVPLRVCSDLTQPDTYRGRVVLMERGDCMFVDKARRVQTLGALAGIVVDSLAGTAAESSPMFAMSGDGTDDVTIPMVFLFHAEGQRLRAALRQFPGLEVTLSDAPPPPGQEPTAGVTGVGHVVAVDARGDDELVHLVDDGSGGQAPAEHTEAQKADAMDQVRLWLRELLQMTEEELTAVAGPHYAPLLADVAALGPTRLAQLLRRLRPGPAADGAADAAAAPPTPADQLRHILAAGGLVRAGLEADQSDTCAGHGGLDRAGLGADQSDTCAGHGGLAATEPAPAAASEHRAHGETRLGQLPDGPVRHGHTEHSHSEESDSVQSQTEYSQGEGSLSNDIQSDSRSVDSQSECFQSKHSHGKDSQSETSQDMHSQHKNSHSKDSRSDDFERRDFGGGVPQSEDSQGEPGGETPARPDAHSEDHQEL